MACSTTVSIHGDKKDIDLSLVFPLYEHDQQLKLQVDYCGKANKKCDKYRIFISNNKVEEGCENDCLYVISNSKQIKLKHNGKFVINTVKHTFETSFDGLLPDMVIAGIRKEVLRIVGNIIDPLTLHKIIHNNHDTEYCEGYVLKSDKGFINPINDMITGVLYDNTEYTMDEYLEDLFE